MGFLRWAGTRSCSGNRRSRWIQEVDGFVLKSLLERFLPVCNLEVAFGCRDRHQREQSSVPCLPAKPIEVRSVGIWLRNKQVIEAPGNRPWLADRQGMSNVEPLGLGTGVVVAGHGDQFQVALIGGELVGQTPGYKNNGRDWQPRGEPVRVGVHDFPDPSMPKAVPYGIYDLAANTGWVSVGCDGDTAAFAVETLRRWWHKVGQATYPKGRRLLVCADAGGSNGYRVRLWKIELAKLATEIAIPITICHFPPGTSKWNKIEHRLFAHISMNWRGRPLTSHEVVVDLIGATTTRTGLTVHAEANTSSYPRGIKITDQEMDAMRPQLKPHAFHGDWNYTLQPRTTHV